MHGAASSRGASSVSRRLDIPSKSRGCLSSPRGSLVPEIDRFLGIVIAMFYGDHAPPHFHARYAEQRAIIDIESLTVLSGWMHQSELRENWRLA